MITAVNTSAQKNYAGSLTLGNGDVDTTWQDLASSETFKVSDHKLQLKIPPGGLRVLLRH
jgi:hypothetical protein